MGVTLMAVTEGGFFASSSPGALGIINPRVPGTTVDFPGGIAAFAAPLLLWVAQEIHENVEHLRDGWCWGYNFRAVRGATVLSDHAGGVAIDINAPSHPRGVRRTWSTTEVAKIRNILAEANRHGRVIAWGEDFNTTDGMHFACRGGKSAVISAGLRLQSQGDWFSMATKADLREVVNAAIDAKKDEIANAVRAELVERLGEDDSLLSRRVRQQVRTAVGRELDERK